MKLLKEIFFYLGFNYLGMPFPFGPWAYPPPVVNTEPQLYQQFEDIQKTIQEMLNVQKHLLASLFCEDRKNCSSIVELEKIFKNRENISNIQQQQFQGNTLTTTSQNGQGTVIVTEFHSKPDNKAI